MARWRKHRRRLRRKIPSATTIIAQSALRSFWSRPWSRRSHRHCRCRLVLNGSNILLKTHRSWPSQRAWGRADLWRRGGFLVHCGRDPAKSKRSKGKRGIFLHSTSGDLPTTARPLLRRPLGRFCRFESRANVEWEWSYSNAQLDGSHGSNRNCCCDVLP